jgi:hypothetical protein
MNNIYEAEIHFYSSHEKGYKAFGDSIRITREDINSSE